MFESVKTLLEEHAEIQAQLSDPAVYADQARARKLGRRSAQLNGIVEAYNRWKQASEDLEAAKEMADEDPDFAAEVEELTAALPELEEKLRRLLIPRDENDSRNVILEVKGGEGGDEAALFAADLLRMYTRFAEHKLEGRNDLLQRVRPGRLQGRPGGDQGQLERPGRGRVRAPEVRGRGAPRAARAGHRIPGPHPHLRRRRAGVPGSR